MTIIYRIVLTIFVLMALGCKADSPKINLDTSVRGDLTQDEWDSFDNEFKFESCLRYKISEMRQLVSKASGPIVLIKYYPLWQDSLKTCEQLYKSDHDKAQILQESVAAEMAKVLGEETASYLHTQRLYKDQSPERDWIEKWRISAIIGIAEVESILTQEE